MKIIRLTYLIGYLVIAEIANSQVPDAGLEKNIIVKIAYDKYTDERYKGYPTAWFAPNNSEIAISTDDIAKYENIVQYSYQKFKNNHVLMVYFDDKTMIKINKLLKDDFQYSFVIVVNGVIKYYNTPIDIKDNRLMFYIVKDGENEKS